MRTKTSCSVRAGAVEPRSARALAMLEATALARASAGARGGGGEGASGVEAAGGEETSGGVGDGEEHEPERGAHARAARVKSAAKSGIR
jgi:hypothetical protein